MHKSLLTAGLFVASLVIMVTSTQAEIVSFENAYSDLGDGGNPATYYQGSHGLTISGNYFGLVGGIGNGDPGNWNLEGTNGSAFLGTNNGVGSGPNFAFASAVSMLTIDVGLPGFNWANTITADGYLNGGLVESLSVSLNSPTDPGNWDTLAFTNSVDFVEVRLGAGSGFAYGVDNLSWSSIPEPSSMSLFALAGTLICTRRKRK